MPLAKLVGAGGGGRVHTFEAHPKTRTVMMFNLLMNNVFDSVTVHAYGLGDESDNGRTILLGNGCVAVPPFTTCDEGTAPSTNSGGFSIAGQAHLAHEPGGDGGEDDVKVELAR